MTKAKDSKAIRLKMNSVRNIFIQTKKAMFTNFYRYILIIILLGNVYLTAQDPVRDSTNSDTKISSLTSDSDQPHSKNNPKAELNNSSTPDSQNFNLEMPINSTITNSEFQMSDGTYWKTNSELNTPRFLGIMGGILVVDFAAYMYQREIWYTEGTTGFHTLDFSDDWQKWQYMDKIGHFTNAFFMSDLTAKLYRWAGISGGSSVWYGAMTGWLWMLQIEISDGFMADWGFSWGDMLTNTLGSAFFVLQQFNYDLLGGIQPKFSWHKSEAWENGEYWHDPGVIEDYEGMTFWLAVNPHHYFPDELKKNYPDWLAPFGIAIGYSAKDIASNPWGGYNEIFIGLDIDVTKIHIGDDLDWFRFFKSELNFLRMPLPAVRITPSGIWYGIYF